MSTELGRLIAQRIALTGPISLADFTAEALGHPRLGYYRKALPVGAAGDFTTAPEISQMFGELLGAWLAERWLAMGRPTGVRLVELGPGRGTLMADALRATRGVPGFHAALDLHLVEINEPLRALQGQALAAFKPTWHARFDDVPEGPMLLVANEFFDALPVRQFEKTARGWSERMVGLADDGSLRLALAPGVTPYASALADAPVGAQAEICEAGLALAAAIGERLGRHGGWALIVDYGHDGALGASLQAVRGHRGADILDRPGETDLSAHVDFAALAAATGRATFGPVGQGDFLRRLGIAERAGALKARASEAQRAAIDAASARLIAPDQMGTLFRVLAVGDDRSAAPVGFSDTPRTKT
ncbi:NADH dehydrogenase [ubiquinone] 1 alpha subcomplex assembly factor 7 [Rhodospirillales bacterium URHD0017]|nr:NADH dehydrogenase [ubiquinone] 1 alpha subcomplex assembly factor 7 [Rhodospirillales bacterium URHD0017]